MDRLGIAQAVLRYWYLIEFLDQPNFPAGNAKKNGAKEAEGKKQVTLYNNFTSLDATPSAIFGEDAKKYPKHGVLSDEACICLGKVKREDLVEYLKAKFSLEDDLPEKASGRICLIGLKCDTTGCYVEKSFSISPMVWGLAQPDSNECGTPGERLSRLLSLERYHSDMLAMEEKLVTKRDDGSVTGKHLTPEIFAHLLDDVNRNYLCPLFGNNTDISNDGLLIYKRYQTEDIKARDNAVLYDSDLSKSFFTNDLQMIADAMNDHKYGSGSSMQEAVVNYIVGPYAEEFPETGWVDFSKRIDIRRLGCPEKKEDQADFFNYHLDVKHTPLGKWPSRYMPALMQQLAVNLGVQPEEGGDILSVNGPPGTGKTTLLKEIIAGNIVERAKLLCAYGDPDDAFETKKFYDGEKHKNGYSKWHSVYYDFKNSHIKDYGMLVASCNNAAVENITKELPDGLALCAGLMADEKDAPELSARLDEVRALFDVQNAPPEVYGRLNRPEPYPDIYFSKYANDLAKEEKEKDLAKQEKEKDWERWGLISAPFGKTSNLNSYAYKVLLPFTNDFGENDKISGYKALYAKAVEQFNTQLAKVENLRQEIGKISGAETRFSVSRAMVEADCKKLTGDILEKQQMLESLSIKASDLESRQAAAQLDSRKAEKDILTAKNEAKKWLCSVKAFEEEEQALREEIIQLESRIGLVDMLRRAFKKTSMLLQTIQKKKNQFTHQQQTLKEEKDSYQAALDALSEKEKILEMLRDRVNQCECDKQKFMADTKNNQKQIKSDQEKIAALNKQIKQEEENCRNLLCAAAEVEDILRQMTVLDDGFWAMYNSSDEAENTRAQVLNPWFTVTYNREREKLFYTALQVHKSFLLASKCCRDNIKNLLLLWRIIGDEDKKLVTVSQRDRENCFAALLNTVFLLTPVLSTTFASAGNMLADIKTPGEIGLLIIDEAGQAQPQMALGAMYRCRRAIVVGDPKQVEPVVTSEMDAVKRIIRDKVNSLYQSKTHSVQAFADRINPIGAKFGGEDGEGETWVGCPLVVHRRCISPMYEISNAVSYDGIMKQQTSLPKPEKEAGFCLPGSQWINVCGSANNSNAKDHYVKAQGERAIILIRLAFTKTASIPSLYVITPFTTVKNGLLGALEKLPEYKTDKRIKEWAEDHIGTVHTFQGKEADEVIFLLGCDKNALPAVRWVNNNIVNVAVTRAKYRLYVLGDYSVWKHSLVMQQAKRILDSHAIRVLNALVHNPAEENASRVESLLGQLPTAETFQAGEDIADELVADFQISIADIWADGDNVTDEQLKRLNLSQALMDEFAPEVRQNILWAIKLYYLFGTLTTQYAIKHMDFSCTGILFCKAMEQHLNDCLLEGLQALFPELHKALNKPRVMVGVFTTVLQDTERRKQLAVKKLVHTTGCCDVAWWEQYYEDLNNFRELRNRCCHPEKFAWVDIESLLKNLFIRKEFHKTLVGKSLRDE